MSDEECDKPEVSFRDERYCDLWKERSDQMGRLVLATVVFAVVAQLKVLAPFSNATKRQHEQQARQVQTQHEVAGIEARKHQIADASNAVVVVLAGLEKNPLEVERVKLTEAITNISAACRELLNVPPEELLNSFKEPEPTRRELQFDARPFEQGGANGVTEPPPRDLRVRRWADVLQIDPEWLASLGPDKPYKKTLLERARVRVQAAADATVRSVVNYVTSQLIKPLESLAKDNPALHANLQEISESSSETRAVLEHWAKDLTQNPSWYETVWTKSEALNKLREPLEKHERVVKGAVSQQQKMLDDEQRRADERLEELRQEGDAIKQELAVVDEKLKEILPEWLRDLISAKQMLQLYTITLLGLLVWLGVLAHWVRHHYRRVCVANNLTRLSETDPFMSSVWTLVYRGRCGTWLTRLVFWGTLVILCGLFERGHYLLATWLAGAVDKSPIFSHTVAGLIHWAGRVLFVIAFLAVPWLLRRAGNPPRLDPATATGVTPSVT